MAVSTVSYTNTPQATDDTWGYQEDYFNSLGVLTLDVLANDLGGNAKKLYSIDDGDGALKDLLTRDPNASTAWEATSDGNLIRLNNGKIEFKFADGFDVNALKDGELYSDTFVYAIQLGNGTISYAKVTLNITGVNDLASISGTSEAEAVEDSGNYQVGGKLNIADLDRGENQLKPVDAESLKGQYGAFSVATDGTWAYSLDNPHAQELGEGEYVDEQLTVTSADGTAQKTITVRVTGINDLATIDGNASGAAAEDGGAYAEGKLEVSDFDRGQSKFKAVNDDALTGKYGQFSFDADGNWTYSLDNGLAQELRGGEQFEEKLVVHSLDGTAEQTITVLLTGENDAAKITGDSAADVTEDSADYVADGKLAVADLDKDESRFAPVGDDALDGKYGQFSFDADGNWSYSLDSGLAQELRGGEQFEEKLVVHSLDGTAEQTITVQVAGINDDAAISGASGADVTEDSGNYTVGGKLGVTDLDKDESGFKAVGSDALNGKYGQFTFDDAGNWSYTLDNQLAQELRTGTAFDETLTVESLDGSAQQTIVVHVHGVDEPVVQPPTPVRAAAPAVYAGTDDPNNFDDKIEAANTPRSGNDTLVGTDDANTLSGGDGNDTIYGRGGTDTLSGDSGVDKLYGGSGNDTIYGGDNNDEIYGGSGDDHIFGNANNDAIFGGSGNDTIQGNDNNDVIIGGFGADTLSGNGGSDTFKFLAVKDTGDTIADFGAGNDQFDFSAIDANTATESDDAFLLAGESVGLSAYSINWFHDGGNTYVQFDCDGNTNSAEFEITLSGTVALDASDFLL